MSFAESVSTPSGTTRRFHVRRKIDGLSYVEFGPDNGAILIDLSEGGLGFQSVLPVGTSEMLLFKFKFPGQSNYVEGFAEVAWMNESGKGGGLRFTELSDETRALIREWTGVLPEAEAGVLGARNGAASSGAAEEPTEPFATDAKSVTSNTESKTIREPDPAAEVSDQFSTGESAQPPSPSTEKDARAAEPAKEAVKANEIVERVAAEIKAPRSVAIPEFTIEVAPPLEAPAAYADSQAPALIPNPGSASAHSATQPANETPAKGVGPQRSASTVNQRGRSARPALDATTPAPVQTRNIPAPAIASPKPDANAKPAVASPISERSRARQAELAHGPRVSENALEKGSDESQTYPTFVLQALRIGAGMAAGAVVVLLMFLAVPSLRTRVEATAARPATLNPAVTPTFEIEVADINNRRWILSSGGQAGSPFSETPSRHEAQSSNLANTARNETAKPSRPEEADDSTTTTAKQSKLAKPAELELRRPRAAQTTTASAQAVPPSIFDGITPPIGSLSDRLATGGPAAPGIVPTETQQPRSTVLQSAVLVQRVSPVYPPNAMQSRVQGDVRVNATIGKDGVPKDLKVISGDLRLVPAALAAIHQWRYRPATLSGEPIETEIVVTVSFQLK